MLKSGARTKKHIIKFYINSLTVSVKYYQDFISTLGMYLHTYVIQTGMPHVMRR